MLRRFRDQKHHWAPASSYADASIALAGALLRVALGYRPERPSISPSATRRLKEVLPPQASIGEFGSGLSTIWFARRFARVASVEHDPAWAGRVRERLSRHALKNVDYVVATPPGYATAFEKYPDGSFDFILIDGLQRDLCLFHAIPKLKPGGWLYLDNTDADLDTADGEMRRAERILAEAVAARGGSLEYFTDFAPINFFAEEGALARL